MHRNCLRYRDTYAAPGSKLHEALLARDTKRAEAIYQQCEHDARELLAKALTARVDHIDNAGYVHWKTKEPTK